MFAISLHEATTTFPSLMQSALHDSEEITIVSDEGAVVMVSQDYWNELQETVRILSDKRALAALLEGHRMRREHGVPIGKSPEEVFADVHH
jgi:PHD/YefM family antitoxin component YafN of YafNO toxin-antitoxin module